MYCAFRADGAAADQKENVMTGKGMNMERVKKQNRSLILGYINDNGPLSRKDIAAATGLTPASVTQITTQLIDDGLLKELGAVRDEKRSVGRKRSS